MENHLQYIQWILKMSCHAIDKGLTNAPAVFQALVDDLRDMLNKFVFVYLDNILILTPQPTSPPTASRSPAIYKSRRIQVSFIPDLECTSCTESES